jgi:two-component system sensor kinase FixL
MVNLFRNALEAMAVSTHRELIASNCRAADDMIEMSVSDTGHGFTGNALSSLFQPFFTTKETGMGVGLSISRTIIETLAAGCGLNLWGQQRHVPFTYRLRRPRI